MDTNRLSEIESRLRLSSPGAWESIKKGSMKGGVASKQGGFMKTVCFIGDFSEQGERDAEFIAHSKEDIGWLVSELKYALSK